MARYTDLLRHWDWLAVILVCLPAMALGSHVMGGPVDQYDEGIHLLSGALQRAGRLPYIDFYPLFPPLWTYAQIIVESVFGGLVVVQRLWFLVQGLVVVVVCYMLLRRVCATRLISLAAIAMVVLFGFDPFWLPRWSGARLAVYILFWLMYRAHAGKAEEGRAKRLFFMGLFVGASNLYAFDVGIHLTITGIFMLLVTLPSAAGRGGVRAARGLIPSAAGFLLPLVVWGAYLSYHGALSGYVVNYYYYYIVLLMPISTEILSGGSLAFAAPRLQLLLLFLAFLASGGAYLLYTGWRTPGRGVNTVPLLAVALSFVASASTVRGVNGTQYQMFAYIPMLLWAAAGVDRAARTLGARLVSQSGRGANTARTAAAGAVILFAAFSVSWSFYGENAAARLRAARANINIFRLAEAGAPRLSAAFSTTPALYGTFDRRFDSMAAYLRSHTRPGEPVLAFPMYVEMMPALAGRHSATRYPVPILVMGSTRGQHAYIEDIERERPRYMVFYPSARFGDISPVEPYFRPVYEYLRERYRPAPDFPNGAFQQIWVRRE